MPGAGKSTLAKQLEKQLNAVHVNKDTLRAENPGTSEVHIRELRDVKIIGSLRTGKSVIVDDTNLNPIHEKRVKDICSSMDADFVMVKLHVPLDECIRRDALRTDGHIGEQGIRYQYNRWIKGRGL